MVRHAAALLAALIAAAPVPALAGGTAAPEATPVDPQSLPVCGPGMENPANAAATIPFPTGDAKMQAAMDVSFVRSMIDRVQGTADIAGLQLNFGGDPELHKLAEDMVASQTKQVEAMKAWLAAHGG